MVGEVRAGTEVLVLSRSPQPPDYIVMSTAAITANEVARRAEAARRDAQRQWVELPAVERAAVLSAGADAVAAASAELADLVTREVGKPRVEAAGELGRRPTATRRRPAGRSP